MSEPTVATPKPENQHYVPQSHLRHFRESDDDGYIYVYQRHGVAPRKKSIAKTAAMPETYAFTTRDGRDTTTVEKALGDFETNMGRVIKNEIQKHRVLAPESKLVMAQFIVSQFRRTPKHKLDSDLMAEKMLGEYLTDGHPQNDLRTHLRRLHPEDDEIVATARYYEVLEKLRKKYDGKIPDSVFPQLAAARSSAVPELAQANWDFLTAPSNAPLLTSDNPVAWNGRGLRKGGLFMFPVTKSCLIQISRNQNGFQPYQMLKTSQARAARRFTIEYAHREVYSGIECHKIQREVDAHLNSKKATFDYLREVGSAS